VRAVPKVEDVWKERLKVTAASQALFLRKYVRGFEKLATRSKNRSKCRADLNQWESATQIAALFWHSIERLKSQTLISEKAILKLTQRYFEGREAWAAPYLGPGYFC
jgi:hypothetical protein